MPSCLLVYYSDSGTTANLARHIRQGLESAGLTVDMYNISRETPPDITGYNMAGIGSPVYFFNPVPAVKKYLNRLGDLSGLPAFIFMAYGTNPGKAPEKLRRILSSKGALDIGTILCRNANFIAGGLKSGSILSLDHISAEELKGAVEFGKKVANEVDWNNTGS